VTAGSSSLRLVVLIVAAVAVGQPALAQPPQNFRAALLTPSIDSMRNAAPDDREAVVDQFLSRIDLLVTSAIAPDEHVRYIAEANRLDKQVGASNSAPGSTNLVSSGSVPRVLGFAVEAGALTQSVSGSSVTFQTNPVGIVEALTTYVPDDAISDDATRDTLAVLRRFNLSATFDTSREPGGPFTGSYRQLQQAGVQVYLRNLRDPLHPRWADAWQQFAQRAGAELPDRARDATLALTQQPAFVQLRTDTRARLMAAGPSEVEDIVLEYVRQARRFIPAATATRLSAAWVGYLRQQSAVYRQLARSSILTVEYTLRRPPVQDAASLVTADAPGAATSDLSTAALVFVRPFIGASDMTLNGSVTLFNEAPAGTTRNLRDWQLSAKLDFPLNGILGAARSRFTLAGLFMRLEQPALGFPVSVNGVAVSESGNLGFLQARLQVPVGDSGFAIPISVTYATRTELIDESRIRGNIGMTLDLDALMARRP
jgi:hypothetical protein